MKRGDAGYFKRISYKKLILLLALCLICIMGSSFFIYKYFEQRARLLQNAQIEAAGRVEQLVKNIDERLSDLDDFFVASEKNEHISWMMEHDIHYSDYSHYTEARNALSQKSEDISGFALVNFRTDWVLSSKGLFSVEEVQNAEDLKAFFENDNDIVKKYWIFNPLPNAFRTGMREYRSYIDVSGLNLVIRLPISSYNESGELVINISREKLGQWMKDKLNPHEDVIILDEDENIVFASDELLLEECMQMQEEGLTLSQNVTKHHGNEKTSWVIASEKSRIMRDWRYYVIYDIWVEALPDMGFTGVWLFSMIILIFAFFLLASFLVYYPVGALAKDMAEGTSGGRPSGNEIYYLADRFSHLKKDKNRLEETVLQLQVHLKELFALRVVRNEVREEEWDEYIREFHLIRYSYFASAVLVLDMKELTEEQSNISEDVICLEILQEMPERLKEIPWIYPFYNACTIVCVFAENSEELLFARIADFHREMKQYVEAHCSYQLLMGVSATHARPGDIYRAYRESVNALLLQTEGNGAGKQWDCRFYIAPMADSQANDLKKYDDSYENRIQKGIYATDRQECFRVTDEFFDSVGMWNHSIEEAKIYILHYMEEILMTAFQSGIDIAGLCPDGVERLYRDILEGMELSRIAWYLKYKLLEPVLLKRTELLAERSVRIADAVIRIIRETKGDITLSEVSERLGLHSTDIWKALKMQRGKTFLELQEEYKLEEAKRLLLHTDMSVNEISAALNYSNTQSFIRFFSKGTGMTPGKFRRLY